MSRLRCFLIVMALIALLLTAVSPLASASGEPFGAAEELAWEEAVAYWQEAPTLCGTITKEVVAPGSLDNANESGVLGSATQPNRETGEPIERCWIGVVEGLEPALLCGVMRHEYGHLLGWSHSDPGMASLVLCGPTAPTEPSITEIRKRQAWEEWRETRAWCREMPPNPQRRHCWRHARRMRRHAARLP
jgi:hypothetical protein